MKDTPPPAGKPINVSAVVAELEWQRTAMAGRAVDLANDLAGANARSAQAEAARALAEKSLVTVLAEVESLKNRIAALEKPDPAPESQA